MRALRSYYVDLLHYWRLRTHLEPSGAGGWCFRARCGIEGDAVEGDAGENNTAPGAVASVSAGDQGLVRCARYATIIWIYWRLCARTVSRRARAYRNANTIRPVVDHEKTN